MSPQGAFLGTLENRKSTQNRTFNLLARHPIKKMFCRKMLNQQLETQIGKQKVFSHKVGFQQFEKQKLKHQYEQVAKVISMVSRQEGKGIMQNEKKRSEHPLGREHNHWTGHLSDI